jgi:hypothetical protein
MAGWSSFEALLGRRERGWNFGTPIYLNGRLALGTFYRRGMSLGWLALQGYHQGRTCTLELFGAGISSIRCRGCGRMLGTLSGTGRRISSLNSLRAFRLMSDESEERTVQTYAYLLVRGGQKLIVGINFEGLNI